MPTRLPWELPVCWATWRPLRISATRHNELGWKELWYLWRSNLDVVFVDDVAGDHPHQVGPDPAPGLGVEAGALPASRDRRGKNKIRGAKVFAEVRRLFLAEITNFNDFSAQKHQLLPTKKIRWGARKKSGRHCSPAPRWRRA